MSSSTSSHSTSSSSSIRRQRKNENSKKLMKNKKKNKVQVSLFDNIEEIDEEIKIVEGINPNEYGINDCHKLDKLNKIKKNIKSLRFYKFESDFDFSLIQTEKYYNYLHNKISKENKYKFENLSGAIYVEVEECPDYIHKIYDIIKQIKEFIDDIEPTHIDYLYIHYCFGLLLSFHYYLRGSQHITIGDLYLCQQNIQKQISELDSKIEGFGDRLCNRFDELDSKIEGFGDRLCSRFDEVGLKIEGFGDRLCNRFDHLENSLLTKIDAKFDHLENSLTIGFDKINAIFDKHKSANKISTHKQTSIINPVRNSKEKISATKTSNTKKLTF